MKRIADFTADVSDPENKRAESVAIKVISDHLKPAGVHIRDTRPLNAHWDFTILRWDREFTVDIKRDTYIEKTGRFAFEMFAMNRGGGFSPSWGVNPRLDFLAVVPASFRYIKILPLHYVRQYVNVMQKMHPLETLLEHKDWREIQIQNAKQGAEWMTFGYAVPLEGAAAFCKVMGAEIIHLDVPEKHHRREPRLLINGKEVRAA